jgi:hypothetical protein
MKHARDRGDWRSSPMRGNRSAGPSHAARVTPLRDYRRRTSRRRLGMRVRGALHVAARGFLVIPPAFWMGMLAGLVAGAVLLAATGHRQLFVRPGVVHIHPQGPVSHGRSDPGPNGGDVPGSVVPG